MRGWAAAGACILLVAGPLAAYAQSSAPPASPPAKTTAKKAGSAGITREQYVIDAKARAARVAGRRFNTIDSAHKGVITRDQFVKYYEERSAQFASRRFDAIDKDHNGVIEQSELDAWQGAHQRGRSGASPAPASSTK